MIEILLPPEPLPVCSRVYRDNLDRVERRKLLKKLVETGQLPQEVYQDILNEENANGY